MTREEILKIAKPILFNGEMVRAILEERKHETRRAIKGVNPAWKYIESSDDMSVISTDKNGMEEAKHVDGLWDTFETLDGSYPVFKSPYKIGDYLYVRETWCNINKPGVAPEYYYFADTKYAEDYDARDWRWRPSIHMPKEAARIFLHVIGERVERLQDITEEGAICEGACGYLTEVKFRVSPVCHFMEIWDSTIKPKDLLLYGFAANNWVRVFEFKRVKVE